MNLDHPYGIKVTYLALFMCDFQLAQNDYKKILERSVWFLCNFGNNSQTMNSLDERLSVAMVLRIVGNFIALPSQTDNVLEEFMDLLALQKYTFPNIINALLK